MKLILTKDVFGLGRVGEVKEVSDGYARNFLIPRHFALPATTLALERIQKEEKERQDKISRKLKKMNDWKRQLENKIFTIKAKTNLKTLFAAVHEKDISSAINAKLDLNIDPEQIIISVPIKSLGIFEAEVRLSDNIKVKIKLNIEPIN